MKNLVLHNLQYHKVDITHNINSILVDDAVYVIKDDLLVQVSEGKCDDIDLPFSVGDSVVQLEFLKEENFVWVGTKTGFFYFNRATRDVVHVSFADDNSDKVIEAAEWSPSRETIVIIANGEVGIYAVDFHEGLLMSITTVQLIVNLNYTVPLGWGSADRQYRSPCELAEIAKYKEEKAFKESNAISISWRENSTMFAVNHNEAGIRKIKVYEFPCMLIHQSEEIVGLQAPLAWRPVGHWIAGFVWTDKRCQVVIFEKKGLVRCRFNLLDTEKVTQLKWCPRGETLAVLQFRTDATSNIDLFRFDNYEMQLKQRLLFDSSDPLLAFDFLKKELALTTLKAVTTKNAATYSFHYKYYSHEFHSLNLCVCVFVHGCEARINLCNYGIMPPPMSELSVNTEAAINFVIFHPVLPQIAFIDCLNVVSIFELGSLPFKRIGKINLKDLLKIEVPLQLYNFTWLTDGSLFCIGAGVDHPTAYYLDKSEAWTVKQQQTLLKHCNYAGGIVEKNTCDRLQELLNAATPPLTRLAVKQVEIGNKVHIFTLSDTNEFVIDEVEVFHDATSFLIYQKYLFVTSSSGKLYGVRLKEEGLNLLKTRQFDKIYSRTIEPGALLVVGIPRSSNIVMHIPRGNLEMCTCRIISIDRIEDLLGKGKWKEAIDIVRLEKVNMNVLVDLNFERFMDGLEEFFRAVAIPTVLSDFLLELRDDNVFNGVYGSCKITMPEVVSAKRQLISSKMIEFMENNDYIYYINPLIIASHLKNTKEVVGDFYRYLQGLFDVGTSDLSVVKIADEAFKFVSNLKSSKELYEGALRTYDTRIILFAAQNAKVEQLEYKPLLTKLKGLDKIRLRFAVNDHLGRYYAAYQYLSRCATVEEELLNYITVHNIANRVLWDLECGSSLHKEVTNIVAGDLIKRQKYEEAASLYYQIGSFKEAFVAYKNGLCWEAAAEVLLIMNLKEVEQRDYLESLVQNLLNSNRKKEAAKVYECYLHRYDVAVAVYVELKMFTDAIRLAQRYKQKDILESTIREGVSDYCTAILNQMERMRSNFIKSKQRLNVIRENKRQKYEMHLTGSYIASEEQDVKDTDSIITSSTLASGHSRSSRTSARSKRKQEAKKHSTKEGSVYEDIALIEVLHNLIREAFDLGIGVRELYLISVKFPCLSILQKVVSLFNFLLELQALMKSSIQEIWPPHLNNIDNSGVDIAVYGNVNVMDAKYRFPPGNLAESWHLSLRQKSL